MSAEPTPSPWAKDYERRRRWWAGLTPEERTSKRARYRRAWWDRLTPEERSQFIAKQRGYVTEWRLRHRERTLLRCARRRAKEAGLPFSITESDIVIPDTCPILGIPIIRGRGSVCRNSPSVDRTIPALGYVKGNVRVISHRANSLKNDATVAEIRAIHADVEDIHAKFYAPES